MEKQGLPAAPNSLRQHGAERRDAPADPPGSSRPEREPAGPQRPGDSPGDLRGRPGTAAFRLLGENGSEAACSPVSKPQAAPRGSPHRSDAAAGLRDLNADRDAELGPLVGPAGCVRAAWRYEVGSGDGSLQMALPLFEGEEEPEPQQPGGGPAERPLDPVAGPRQAPQEGAPQEEPPDPGAGQEVLVVLNLVQEKGKEEVEGWRAGSQNPVRAGPNASMDPENCSSASFCQSGENLNCLGSQNLKRTDFRSLNEGCVVGVDPEVDGRVLDDVVLTDRYCQRLCGRISAETDENRSSPPGPGGTRPTVPGTAEAEGDRDSSDLVAEPSGPVGPASETFSGTITINNQSIIVSIENGVLTLAAPPEGGAPRDNDMVSLKEHLGMKDHEDIVLLNYDGGTKSIGKMSTLAPGGPGRQDEPRPGLSASDSEFALGDDCTLSELGTSLDSCPLVKQEAGLLCAVTEADLVSPSPGVAIADGDSDEVQSSPLVRSKKEVAAMFGCREPGCSCLFDSRQKLKVHLLNHGDEPRPFHCAVEGCGWAFATSYKLKRHLQSHDKQRPHGCQVEGCGRRFTTVYNLKAHLKVHQQDGAFACQVCSQSFRSAARLASHQRAHFEPQRPHKCEFPGCEKTFITFSALFSHNRTHFREAGHFGCSFPGCQKTYDKACRLKIHMRSHTGERPFVCDSEGCGWSFTSMSKLLRHKRKHEDDRRFVCSEEGCGKSFTRAEHLKGHSITHLGTKPFQCHAEGCSARFSARSSLYIHSKKHRQDGGALRPRCPVASCSKHFSSRSSLKSHMLKHHHLNADVLSQMETTPTLTPSSELISSPPTSGPAPGPAPGVVGGGGEQLPSLDLSSLFSVVPGGAAPPAGLGVGVPVAGGCSSSIFTMDVSLVSSGILTIDPSSVGGAKALDPLILAACADMCPHHGLEGAVGDVLPPQGTLNLDDVQTVTPEALGTLTALALQGPGAPADPCLQHPLSVEPAAPLAVAPGADMLASPSKVGEVGGPGGAGPLLGCVEVLGAPEGGGKVLTQFVFPGRGGFSPQKGADGGAAAPSGFLDSGGSARTDYRAIQLAKKRKQRGPAVSPGAVSQRKGKAMKTAAPPPRFADGAAPTNAGLSLRDPVSGGQYIHVQLLQDDPAAEGDLSFQLSSQASSSHSQLTVDLPVNILQEPSVMTEDDNNSDNSQFTGSTINLQDLE